jgi:hypothetical protein
MSQDTEFDSGLSERIRALRERDRADAPAFTSLIARIPSRTTPRPARFGWAAGGIALAAAVGAFLVLQPPPPQPDAGLVALPAWPTQTAFLLADTGASSRRLGWTSAPTSGLGRSTFTPIEEYR